MFSDFNNKNTLLIDMCHDESIVNKILSYHFPAYFTFCEI